MVRSAESLPKGMARLIVLVPTVAATGVLVEVWEIDCLLTSSRVGVEACGALSMATIVLLVASDTDEFSC